MTKRFLERFISWRFEILVIIAMIPFLAALCFAVWQYERLSNLQEKITFMENMAQKSSKIRNINREFWQKHALSDSAFVDKELEGMDFLTKERFLLENLNKIGGNGNLVSLDMGFDALREEKNCLFFIEENSTIKGKIKETELKQKQTVEVDEQDLDKLLSLIDCEPIGSFLPPDKSPQLLVKSFSLIKNKNPEKGELFELDMTLIKREFLEKL